MTKKQSITTKSGDQGKTKLYSGEQVSKSSLHVHALGDIDELVSVLGIVYASCSNDDYKKLIQTVQKTLFIIASEIATLDQGRKRLKKVVDEQDVIFIEEKMQQIELTLPVFKNFIIPGAMIESAYLDFSRTLTRRCERNIVQLYDENIITNKYNLIWVNRLSDLLWLLAREVEKDNTIHLK